MFSFESKLPYQVGNIELQRLPPWAGRRIQCLITGLIMVNYPGYESRIRQSPRCWLEMSSSWYEPVCQLSSIQVVYVYGSREKVGLLMRLCYTLSYFAIWVINITLARAWLSRWIWHHRVSLVKTNRVISIFAKNRFQNLTSAQLGVIDQVRLKLVMCINLFGVTKKVISPKGCNGLGRKLTCPEVRRMKNPKYVFCTYSLQYFIPKVLKHSN